MLMDVRLRLPEIDLELVPDEVDTDIRPAAWTIPCTQVSIVRIENGPRAGQFPFSAKTGERLPDWHAQVIDLPPLRPTAHDDWRLGQMRFTGQMLPFGLVEALPPAAAGDRARHAALENAADDPDLRPDPGHGAGLGAPRAAHTGRSSTAATLAFQLSTPLMLMAAARFVPPIFIQQINIQDDLGEVETLPRSIILHAAAAWEAWIVILLAVEAIIATPRISEQSYDAHLLRLIKCMGTPSRSARARSMARTRSAFPRSASWPASASAALPWRSPRS